MLRKALTVHMKDEQLTLFFLKYEQKWAENVRFYGIKELASKLLYI